MISSVFFAMNVPTIKLKVLICLNTSVLLQEAVAIQLEGERLVKIRDVLKELPPPHFRCSPPPLPLPLNEWLNPSMKPFNVTQCLILKYICSIILIQDRLLSSHSLLRKQISIHIQPAHSRLKINQFTPPTCQELCVIQHFTTDTLIKRFGDKEA